MPYRYYLLLLFLSGLLFSAYAQRRVTFGPLIAIGTGGVQESLKVEPNQTQVAQGIRLARAYRFGVAVDWVLGKGGRSLGAELVWHNSESRFVQEITFFNGSGTFREREIQQARFAGGQVNALFRQRLLTDRSVNPLLEAGLGAFIPSRTRQRIYNNRNRFDTGWVTVDDDRLRSVQPQVMAGFGVQWGERLFTTLRFTLPTGLAIEDGNDQVICIDFCRPVRSIRQGSGVGLHTQMLHLGYLF